MPYPHLQAINALTETEAMPDDYPEFGDCEYGYDDDWNDELDDEEDEWERAAEECGILPPHLGGGCQLSGTEYCDFECPFRDNPEWLTGETTT